MHDFSPIPPSLRRRDKASYFKIIPPTGRIVGPDLDIQLDRIDLPYQPGDVITGRIVRRSHIVSPRATVSIQLLGRAKTKICVTTRNGNSTSHSYYRGRFNFFDAAQTRRELHDGPVHIPPHAGPGQWEFAVDVPSSPSPRALVGPRNIVGEGNRQEGSFLSLNANDIASHPLPPAFETEGRKRNKRYECYVEYHLEASLNWQGSHAGTVTATYPIKFRALPLPYPLSKSNFGLRHRLWPCAVSTFHLLPGMENADLTFKQKLQQVFHSSKVPQYGFTMDCFCPTTIQIRNPAPVPFLVRILPESNRTSEILQDVPRTARLKSLELVIKAETAVVASGTFRVIHAEDVMRHRIIVPVSTIGEIPVFTPGTSGKHENMNRQQGLIMQASAQVQEGDPKAKIKPEDASHHQADDEATSSTTMPGTESLSDGLPSYESSTNRHSTKQDGPLIPGGIKEVEETYLDVGTAVDLRIYSTSVTALGRSIGQSYEPLYPSFTTYCIRHTHRLAWKMVIEIVGETVKIEGEEPITLIGESAA